MSQIKSGEEQGLTPIAVVDHDGHQVKVYRNAEGRSYALELYLSRFLPIPAMTELVGLAIKAAEAKGEYVLDAKASFCELNGKREPFDIRAVRW